MDDADWNQFKMNLCVPLLILSIGVAGLHEVTESKQPRVVKKLFCPTYRGANNVRRTLEVYPDSKGQEERLAVLTNGVIGEDISRLEGILDKDMTITTKEGVKYVPTVQHDCMGYVRVTQH